jgi:AcrR family transcriptional regulator
MFNAMTRGTPPRSSKARERLVATAERLFYADGIHAVGIDRIIAEAGVAKMTLYNHFASKDDLILAVLQYREEKFDEMFASWMTRSMRRGRNRLDAFFAALKKWFEQPGFRGCSFINAAVELADAKHPAARFAAEHKARFREMLLGYMKEVAGKKAESLVPAVYLLVEGAIVTAVMEESSKPADWAKQATLLLLAQK